MSKNKRSFWLTLSLINLFIVALFGFTLRSKILFPLNFIDFRSVESAHSHFAFAGWVGLSLITLLIYDVLPSDRSQKRIYQWILAGIEVSSIGMAATFPFFGYVGASIFFSTLFIVSILVFAPVFIRDVLGSVTNKNIKLLSISAIVCQLLSFLGALGLVFIIAGKSSSSFLYRDSIYVFLHFQYNGFFTLSVFALLLKYIERRTINPGKSADLFSLFLCLSIIPCLFLSLLWHNKLSFYIFGGIGCVFIVCSLIFFFRGLRLIRYSLKSSSSISKTFLIFSMLSFVLKMLLQVISIIPQLSTGVYGDRPVIIGFLHLVFLGFVTFFILSTLIENGYFTKKEKLISFPFVIFSIGIIANEVFLMLQGLGILLQTNSDIYNWFLWVAAAILFSGALLIAFARFYIISTQEKRQLFKQV